MQVRHEETRPAEKTPRFQIVELEERVAPALASVSASVSASVNGQTVVDQSVSQDTPV